MKYFSKNSKQETGFTLIEAVVATAIFAFTVSSIVGVYVSTIQVDRKTRALRTVSQNARFITEFLTKEIRNGSIDYSKYSGGVVPSDNTHLHILNQAGEAEDIYTTNPICSLAAPCDLIITKNSSISNLNAQAVKVTNLKFYITPDRDPYGASPGAFEQPRVTMVLELNSPGLTVTDKAFMDLETTFSSRSYPPLP